MRTYGVLSESGEILYLYEKYQNIDLDETELEVGDALIRIDAYTVLAVGPSKKWTRD